MLYITQDKKNYANNPKYMQINALNRVSKKYKTSENEIALFVLDII
jgi:hypothetical protein